ncbi:MAG: hypothetical protein SVU88_01765 [Candidatus Nanohaloarchaea archaeon]|nr:hypothetical protein [Candidatus Nanohaloarchaea archaeon]
MEADTFAPLFGLATVLAAHTYFYVNAYNEDSGFSGLLATEEDALMDSMIAVGAIQVLYFLWRSIIAVFDVPVSAAAIGVSAAGLALLGLFSHRSSALIQNMADIREQYGFEVTIG